MEIERNYTMPWDREELLIVGAYELVYTLADDGIRVHFPGGTTRPIAVVVEKAKAAELTVTMPRRLRKGSHA